MEAATHAKTNRKMCSGAVSAPLRLGGFLLLALVLASLRLGGFLY
jgi:hypothetical protein